MTSMSLQFHADRREIAVWIESWAEEFGLHVAAQTFVPDPVTVVMAAGALAEDIGKVDRVVLSRHPFDIPPTSAVDVVRGFPHSLFVALGQQTDELARESAMSCMTDDSVDLNIWRAIFKKAKAGMLTGSTVVNPVIGAEQPAVGTSTAWTRELADRRGGVGTRGGCRHRPAPQPLGTAIHAGRGR